MSVFIPLLKITFNVEKLKELVAARDKAIAEGKESFVFEGQEMVVAYAEYLIQYLSSRLL